MAVQSVSYYFFRVIRICADIFTDFIGVVYRPKRNYLPPLADPLLLEPAIKLVDKIKKGQLKSEDLVKSYINRIQVVNPLINALTDQRFDSAIEEAKHIDQKIAQHLSGDKPDETLEGLPLLGIPVSIKECHAVKDMSYTSGLLSRKGVKAKEDAHVVRNLRDAGAIPLCVTNVPEYLLNYDTYNRLYGQTNNPYDKSRTPGGSSGGECALISSAGSLLGIGSDLGGSLRIPSFFCGIFGHKPTRNVVPITEIFPSVGHKDREKLLQVGPLCRYASDLKPMLRACAGKKISSLNLDKELDLNQLRVYYMKRDGDPFKTPVSQEVLSAMESVVQFLNSKTGWSAEEVEFPLMKDSFMIWTCTLNNLEAPYLSDELTEGTSRVSGWGELCKWMCGRSDYRLSTALNVILHNILDPDKSRFDKKFQKLVSKGEKIEAELTELLGDNGILIYPTLPETAPKHNGSLLKINSLGYTMIFNVTGHPVTQVPLGLSQSGLPVGLQIVSNPFNDYLTIGVAELLEKEFGGWVPPFDIESRS